MKNEVIQAQIKLSEEANIKGEILIGYLETFKKSLSKEDAAKTDLKIEALRNDIKFNHGYIEYAKTLL